MRSRLVIMVALAAAVLVSVAPAHAGRLKPADRREINAVLDRFVLTAVRRKNPGAAWALATPALRGGTTKRDWARGDTPAYPYPAKGRTFHSWYLLWADPNDVGFELTLQPMHRERKRIGAMVISVEMRRLHGRWLVDSFVPHATFAPEGARPRMFSERDLLPPTGPPAGTSRLGEIWWVAVIGVLALGPLAAIAAWIVVGIKRGRIRGLRQRREPLPSLPPRITERLSVDK